ncbi:hypothetical protein PSTEL_00570 [Paenibacillus stellifer]|uniref:Uncharacterized protein n=1 Tax=Paenibacillus stellifer TaxID=169760 RepID=A0A089LJY0_9BACL|nr:hypothetical protein [Paenibacillus stellifer]AIQ61846.1 hypothetical protein PSTEL_00570 [Paenibacillus stellifer]
MIYGDLWAALEDGEREFEYKRGGIAQVLKYKSGGVTVKCTGRQPPTFMRIEIFARLVSGACSLTESDVSKE